MEHKVEIKVDVVGGKIEGLDGFGNVYVVEMPSQFMAETASESERGVYEYFKQLVLDVCNKPVSESVGFVIPSDTDIEGNRLFTVKVYSKAPPVYLGGELIEEEK